MAEPSHNVAIGSMSLTNAKTYNRHGKTSTRVKVEDGGHCNYSSKTEINAGVYNHNEVHQADPLKELHAHTAIGALHSSEERVDAPKCHEETRKAVQEDILSGLTRDGDGSRGLLWLTGPAGGGKTAIVGTVCDRLKADGRLAAAFYFSSHKGSVNRTSKRLFVTTLAYQMRVHPVLKECISNTMLSNIQHDPGIFEMDLKTQMEELILKPCRYAQGQRPSTTSGSLVVAIDGVDECGEPQYDDAHREREKDQVEVLHVLLQAIQDPAFPCRIIIASRPENWIRRFFDETITCPVTEIFLDDKYSPDADIALFLKSRCTDLGRQYGYDTSLWPKEEHIKKLVEDASGQFVYAATVMRFINSPTALPKEQLEVILKIRPPAGSSPFQALDALYTAILTLSPSPKDSVLWMTAVHHVESYGTRPPAISAWTIDRIFESSEGQSRAVLGLPSLIYQKVLEEGETDFFSDMPKGNVSLLPAGYLSEYSFYHKSILDFLGDPARSGVAFPGTDKSTIKKWIGERIAKVVECDGPEVPIDPALLPTFRKCFARVWAEEMYAARHGRIILPQCILDKCDPAPWIIREVDPFRPGVFLSLLFIQAHGRCHFYRCCGTGCRRWREVVLEEWELRGYNKSWFGTWYERLLDRFVIRRRRWRHPDLDS